MLRFVFSFLYTRNWHTGQQELSLPRVALFVGMVALIALVVLLGLFLQTPITYDVVTS